MLTSRLICFDTVVGNYFVGYGTLIAINFDLRHTKNAKCTILWLLSYIFRKFDLAEHT